MNTYYIHLLHGTFASPEDLLSSSHECWKEGGGFISLICHKGNWTYQAIQNRKSSCRGNTYPMSNAKSPLLTSTILDHMPTLILLPSSNGRLISVRKVGQCNHRDRPGNASSGVLWLQQGAGNQTGACCQLGFLASLAAWWYCATFMPLRHNLLHPPGFFLHLQQLQSKKSARQQ